MPEAVVGVVATAAASFSKNMTISKLGRLPVATRRGVALLALGGAAAGGALASMLSALDLLSDTRVTPSMSCRRAIRRATSRCSGAQPVIVIAGAAIGGAQRAAAAAGVGADVARERVQRDVGRDGAREVAQGLLPVEARAGEILDGLHAGLGHRVEVGVGLELVGLALKRLSALGDLGEVGLALLDGVVGQDVARDACNAGGEHAEDDESARAARGLRAGAELRGGLGGAARVGGKEVDGSHAPGIGTP